MTIRTTGQSRGAKAKGRAGEQAVADYMRSRGFAAERRRLTGVADVGDIGGCRKLVVSVKAEKRINLSDYLNELAKMVEAADTRFPEDQRHVGVAIIKKRGTTDAGEWYACMSLAKMVDLLRLLGFQ